MPRLALGATIGLVALCVVAGQGRAAEATAPRIVGGGKANAAGWQFAVALEQKRRLTCTASLIAPKRRAPRIKVTAVQLDPKYNGKKDTRDFAVLTLASAPAAQPIALPTQAEAKTATQPGGTVRSAGWGTRSPFGFNVAQRLKTAKERVFAARKCQRVYSKPLFNSVTMICALGGLVRRVHGRLRLHSTTCTGDSGGPVVANTAAGPRLVGAVSAGVFPCGVGGPSIYARVASQLGFIQRALTTP